MLYEVITRRRARGGGQVQGTGLGFYPRVKVHLDGYNLADYLTGKGPDPRKDFFYFNDDA